VLSGRGIFVGLITRPEVCYRLLCVYLSVIVNPRQRGGLGSLGAVAQWLKKSLNLSEIATVNTVNLHIYVIYNITLYILNL